MQKAVQKVQVKVEVCWNIAQAPGGGLLALGLQVLGQNRLAKNPCGAEGSAEGTSRGGGLLAPGLQVAGQKDKSKNCGGSEGDGGRISPDDATIIKSS